MDDLDVLNRLVPAPEAIETLAKTYARRDLETPMKAHRETALHSILNRLAEGVLEAWSTRSHFIHTRPIRDGDPPYYPNDQYSYFHEEGPPRLIPPIFWQCLAASKPACKDCDLVAGDFSFEGVGFAGGNCSGSAFAVYFDLRGLPAEAVHTDHFQLVDEIKALMATCEAAPAQPHPNARAEDTEDKSFPADDEAHKRRKGPQLSEANIRQWLIQLGNELELIPIDALWQQCLEQHPDHSISRQRFRDAIGYRKRGPKQKLRNNAKK